MFERLDAVEYADTIAILHFLLIVVSKNVHDIDIDNIIVDLSHNNRIIAREILKDTFCDKIDKGAYIAEIENYLSLRNDVSSLDKQSGEELLDKLRHE